MNESQHTEKRQLAFSKTLESKLREPKNAQYGSSDKQHSARRQFRTHQSGPRPAGTH